eukprot:jgi/Sobl393_1/3791/SZX67493.1
MSAPPKATPRADVPAAARRASDEQQDHASRAGDSSSSSRSGPRTIPRGRGTGSSSGGNSGGNSRGSGSRDHAAASGSPGAAHLAGSSPHQQGSSPADRSSGMRSRRYGKWPSAGSSPAGGGVGSSSRQGSGKSFTFNWPAYMDREQLSHAMKRGHVFRAKFRLNASNRTEAFCTLEGLPSDMTIRGEVNHNRAVEGDEVAVLPFKLKDWFVVYKEREKLAEAGLLPEGKADPLALAEELANMAIAANDDAGVAAAQSPWTVAGGTEAALKVIEDALRARPDMRVTGKVVAILEPSPRREAIVGVLLTPAAAMAAAAAAGGSSSSAALPPPAAAAAAALASGAYEGCLMLVPLDPRLPKGLLPPGAVAELPEELRAEAAATDLTSRTFVAAAISQWPAGSAFPLISVRTSLGPTGDIEAGTAALLAGEGIREEDFSLE